MNAPIRVIKTPRQIQQKSYLPENLGLWEISNERWPRHAYRLGMEWLRRNAYYIINRSMND